jgi:hypothetical protein
MPRIASTGNIQLHYLPAVADKAAPTVTEIGAGVDLTDFLLRDGLSLPLDGNTIDVAGAAERYNSTDAGTFGGNPIRASFFRDSDDAEDLAWDTLPRGTRGFFLVSRFEGSDETLATGDRVEVWPIVVISRSHRDIEQDGAYRFDVSCAVPTPPDDDAVIAT